MRSPILRSSPSDYPPFLAAQSVDITTIPCLTFFLPFFNSPLLFIPASCALIFACLPSCHKRKVVFPLPSPSPAPHHHTFHRGKSLRLLGIGHTLTVLYCRCSTHLEACVSTFSFKLSHCCQFRGRAVLATHLSLSDGDPPLFAYSARKSIIYA